MDKVGIFSVNELTPHFLRLEIRYAKIHFAIFVIIGFVFGFIIWGIEHETVGFLDSVSIISLLFFFFFFFLHF